MRQVIWVPAVVFLLSAGALADDPAPDKAERKPDVWMQKKLKYSQQILAGIAAGDFDQIAKSGDTLKGMDKIESFIRARTPRYRVQLQLFQDANEEIMRQADAENLEGVTLAFNQLTISCVNCHKHLREQEKEKQKEADLEAFRFPPLRLTTSSQEITER